jgi:hypothetical protein
VKKWNKKKRRKKMLPYVASRGVKHLVHFTRVENVDGILTRGLIGREDLGAEGLEFLVNDQHRFDYQPNATCLSISFPNYKMFYALRQKDPAADWAVLRLKPEILRDKRCAFARMNAASREMACTPLEERTSKSALESMFLDHDGFPHRVTLRIPDHYTTNPQAEVLALQEIEPKYIQDVLFNAKGKIQNIELVRQLVRNHKGMTQFLYGPPYFQPRSDYTHWRGI